MSDSNFTMAEVRQLCISFIALVAIYTIFFHSGVFADELQEEPPDFNYSSGQFVQAGEFPSRPSSPSTSYVCPTTCNEYTESEDISDVHYVSALPKDSTGDTNKFEVNFYNTSSNTEHGEAFFNESGENTTFSGDGYEIAVTLIDENKGVFEYRILSRPEGSEGFWESLPLVGGVFSTGDAVGAGIAYLVGIVFWVGLVLIQFAIDVIALEFELLTFVIDFLVYFLTGWKNIVNALNDIHFAISLLVIVPQIPLWFIFFNGIAKIVKALPFT